MIGRFLLGSGLGALVGTGLLALASVISPAPQGARLADAAPGDAADMEAVPSGSPDATVAGDETETEDSSGSELAGAAALDDAPGAAEPVQPSATAPAATEDGAPAAVEDQDMAAAPVLADPPAATWSDEAAIETDVGPEAPVESLPPPAPVAPDSPADLAGDASPAPAEVPAAAPEGIAAEAPVAPTAPDPAGLDPDFAAPGPAEAGPVATDPPSPPATDLAEAPPADVVPAPAPSPGLPPLTPPSLTPEEEARLAEIVAEGSGSAVPPEAAPPADGGEAAEDWAGRPAASVPPTETEDGPSPLLTETEDDRVIRTGEESSTLPPTPSLAESADAGVATGRLPRIESATEDPVSGEAAEAETPVDTRPIAAFARSFDNPEAKPAFAIVLIDEGGADLDRAALAALPFPVSFALDPTDPLAAEHAAVYRAAGQEVVMLATALPKGGQAADIEVALSAMASALPETVAVMDLPQRVFQADRPLATLVVPVVWAGGRGLLSWDQGLNAADQVARREAVPSAVVFRDLDGEDEAAPVIRRYLDRAAFKAAQEGRVTVVGRARPETVAALLEWAVEGRAATVALAPLTAVLTVN